MSDEKSPGEPEKANERDEKAPDAVPPIEPPAERDVERDVERDSEPPVSEPSSPRNERPAPQPQGFWSFLRDTYATADPRSLALFRIALATLLFIDVARRWPDIESHYANTGWLSNHFMLFRPMSDHLFSIYLACTTPGEVKTLMVIQLVVCVLLGIGWQTRLMHVLSALLIVSLGSRNIMLENGGWVVLNLLVVWSMFLPLGRRFSVDALLRSLRQRRETTISALNERAEPPRDTSPVVSLAVAALIAQWIVIYYFNVVHKTGREWRDGTAVYYFFQQDRMVTLLGAWVRESIPLIGFKLMTYSALVMESAIALLLASPFRTPLFRMVAWGLCCALHLSIDAVVQLGPFSWAMVTMFWVLIPREAWDHFGPKVLSRWPRRELCVDPDSGFWLSFGRVVKRFDVLERVTFRPVAPIASPDDEDVDETAAAEPPTEAESLGRAVGETLVVRDPSTDRRYLGLQALIRLADAVPFGRLLVLPARIPGLDVAIERRLERAAADRARVDAYFEVEGVPGRPEAPPAEPSAARVLVRRATTAFNELCVLAIIVSCGSQVLIENRAVPKWLKPERRPEWMTAIVVYPRLFQGWSMFAPSPPSDDGRVVVEGVTKSGKHLDPLTGVEPSFEVQPKDGYRMNQIWGDFHRRIGESRFEGYQDGVREMLKNYHQITGKPENELVSFEVWFVNERIPPPGERRVPSERRRLFSWSAETPKERGTPARSRPRR